MPWLSLPFWIGTSLRQMGTWLRSAFIVRAAIAVIIWAFSATFLQDLLVYGAFIFALFHVARGSGAWKQPAGLAFSCVLLYSLLSLPFAMHPGLALRDFSGILKLLAGMFAIPVIFYTPRRIQAALFYSAVAIVLVLAGDLLRLAWSLGPELLLKAHAFRPFVLNHPNVASIMAGAAAFIWFYFFWIWRRRWLGVVCLLCILICLAYQIILASRGPQIAFAVAAVGLGLLLPGWRRKFGWLAIMIVAASIIIPQAQHINPRFAEKESMETFSTRDIVWQHTSQLIADRPLFGHGYGKRTFVKEYYASQPPPSPFHYPHCHQFWLKLLFEFGWIGLLLHLSAWLILAWQLAQHIFRQSSFAARLLPGTIGLILLQIHLYGLGDYPDNIVLVAQFWLIPLALMLMHLGKPKEPLKHEPPS